LRHREIAHVGGMVTGQRPEIAGVRDLVTLRGGLQARLGGLLALQGIALALSAASWSRSELV
jgi:hypothetical protein